MPSSFELGFALRLGGGKIPGRSIEGKVAEAVNLGEDGLYK
jgi:hypothetical protein